MQDIVTLPGLSGRVYQYWYLPSLSSKDIKSAAGNYMMVKFWGGQCIPIYIGIAEDLSQRLPGHEMLDPAIRHGATHLYAHTSPEAWVRMAEERDLIRRWNPVLNTQHRLDDDWSALIARVFARR